MPPKESKSSKGPKVSQATLLHTDVDVKRVLDNYPRIAMKYNLEVISSVYTKFKTELAAIKDGVQTEVPTFPIVVSEPMSFEAIRALLSVLETYPWLRQLTFWRCNVGDDGSMLIADFLKNRFKIVPDKNPWGVEVIELQDNHISPKGAGFLGRVLTQNETVKVLNLDFNPIGSEGAQQLGDGLKWNSTLEKLSLHYCGIGPEGGEAIGMFIVRSSSVKDLQLRGNPLGPHGVMHIAHALAKNAYLTKLDLVDTSFGIDLEAVEALRDGIESNDTLLEIDLHLNSIVPAGVAMLAEVIKTKPKVIKMEMYERIGDTMFKEILSAVQANKKRKPAKDNKAKPAVAAAPPPVAT